MRKQISTENISPTAHYTGYVWHHANLGHKKLSTLKGALFYYTLKPIDSLVRSLVGISLEDFLMQRHLVIDHILRENIKSGRISQVVEIACGLSPRALRFKKEFHDLVYIEADLPEMLAIKKGLLKKNKLINSNHYLLPIDALASTGDYTIEKVISPLLDKTKGTFVITEGLIGYFGLTEIKHITENILKLADSSKSIDYIADIYLQDSLNKYQLVNWFKKALGFFVSRDLNMAFESSDNCINFYKQFGFEEVSLVSPEEFKDKFHFNAKNFLVHILKASIG